MLNLYLHGGSINLRPEALTLTRLIGKIFNHAYDHATNAEMMSKLRKGLTQFGTNLLFNKTVAFADDVARTTMDTAQSVMEIFRIRVVDAQKEYQALEHAEQVKIAEQKRVEQAKAAAAQQKARQEEAARRAALEKETAYTRTLDQRLQAGHLDHSGTLRRYYAPEALEANANRTREERSVPLVDPKALEGREKGMPLPIPNPLGMMPMVFASAGIPLGGLPGLTPFVFPNGMVITKDGNGVPVLRTPGGEGVNNGVDVESFPVQRRQPDVTGIPADTSRKPDATGISAAPSADRGPQVGVFPRTPVTGPDVLMAKKSGDGAGQSRTRPLTECPEFAGLFPESTLQLIQEKIPPELGVPSLIKKGKGIRWKTDYGRDNIRIDRGDPSADQPCQHVDHVRVNRGGKVIGRDGQEILKSPSIKSPSDEPEAHIPLSEWLQWREVNTP